MDIKLFITKDYENKLNPTLGENKPNSKPIAQEPQMNVTPTQITSYPLPFTNYQYAKQTQFKPNQACPDQSLP